MTWPWVRVEQVRRSILDASGDEVGYGKGSVVGWLPAEQSDFVDERTNRPAALWHVEYVEVCENLCRCPPADMGAEDLEEDEVAEAAAAFTSEHDPPSWYVTSRHDETPQTIARQLRVGVRALVGANAPALPALRPSSRLKRETWLVVPSVFEHAAGTPPASDSLVAKTPSPEDRSGVPETECGVGRRGDRFESMDECGVFLFEKEEAAEERGPKRVRFANMLLPVVRAVEHRAQQTEGRWTRGRHKKTSDQMAEMHLKGGGLGQLGAASSLEAGGDGSDRGMRGDEGQGRGRAGGENGVGTGGGGCTGVREQRPILKPFELWQSMGDFELAWKQCEARVAAGVLQSLHVFPPFSIERPGLTACLSGLIAFFRHLGLKSATFRLEHPSPCRSAP